MPKNLSFLRGTHENLEKIRKKANGSLTLQNYNTEMGLTGANALSGSALQAAFDAIPSVVEGAFYLTTDSERLYTEIDSKLVELNQSISIYDEFDDFEDDINNLEFGHFYYMQKENIMAICRPAHEDPNDPTKITGKEVIQINPNDDTKINDIQYTTDSITNNKNILLSQLFASKNTLTNTIEYNDVSIVFESINTDDLTIISEGKKRYEKTKDLTVKSNKIYYTYDSNEKIYTKVTSPDSASLQDYYEQVADDTIKFKGSSYNLNNSGVNTGKITTLPVNGEDTREEKVYNKITLNKIKADGTTAETGSLHIIQGDNITLTNYLDTTNASDPNKKLGFTITATDTKLKKEGLAVSFDTDGALEVALETTTSTNSEYYSNSVSDATVPEVLYGIGDNPYVRVDTSANLDSGTRYYTYDSTQDTYTLVTTASEAETKKEQGNLFTRTENSAKFIKGLAELDVYTKSQVDNKIAKALQNFDALHYKNTVSSQAELDALTNVALGDVYIVSGSFSGYDNKDLLIATGEENANGILEEVTWTHVPSGDDEFTAYLYKKGYVVSQNNIDRKLIETDKGANQESLQITTTETQETVYTLTLDSVAQSGKTYYAFESGTYIPVSGLTIGSSSVSSYYEKTGLTGEGGQPLTGIKTTISLVWGSFN